MVSPVVVYGGAEVHPSNGAVSPAFRGFAEERLPLLGAWRSGHQADADQTDERGGKRRKNHGHDGVKLKHFPDDRHRRSRRGAR